MSTLQMNMTITNNTTETFVLADYKGCDKPTNEIGPNGTGKVTASSSFDIDGSVTYKSQSETASINVSFSMPLVGDNSFKGSSDPDGTYAFAIKDKDGYASNPDVIVTMG